jgi:hypothetical protein
VRSLEDPVLGRASKTLAACLESGFSPEADASDDMEAVGVALRGILAEVRLLRVLSLEQQAMLPERAAAGVLSPLALA